MNFFVHDYRTLEEVKAALKAGNHPRVWIYQGADVTKEGWVKVHGPNPPANHTWTCEAFIGPKGQVMKVR